MIIDHVPNHCSVERAELNPHWWAMLRDGPDSPDAAWFDIDWELTGGRVIIPKLGQPVADAIAAGSIAIGDGDLGPELTCGSLRLPLAAGTEHLEPVQALERQHYLLTHWRDPARNVRRFFTIDDLVAVRVEDPDVAATVDSIPRRLTDHPAFAGVRVDHVDGLADPGAYLRSLRGIIGDRWLLVEKILASGEVLPRSWPVDGTTGYEQITVVEHTMLDPRAEAPLTDLWHDLTGDARPFSAIEDEARREVMDGGLAPDVDRLVRLIDADPASRPATRDAVVELTLALERYRTYLPEDQASMVVLAEAGRRAARSQPASAAAIGHVVATIAENTTVQTAWQQLTGPVMAKGAEDRAFYRYLRLASLCEVGGTPATFTVGAEAFHHHQRQVQANWPVTMLAGTTHDTKRSDGVRARSLALAEVAEDWTHVVRSWFDEHGDDVASWGLDPAIVLLALQTAVTAAPISVDRLGEYLLKSAREADLRTTWIDPDEAYESGLWRLAALLADGTGSDLASFEAGLDLLGRRNAITEVTLQLTCPGVPDLYQGSLVALRTLVDPDNRTNPDWDERRQLLQQAAGLDVPTAWRAQPMATRGVVVERVLALRRRHAASFGREASYEPLTATGPAGDDILAFARGDSAGPQVIVIVGRRRVEPERWAATTIDLPAGPWTRLLVDGGPPLGDGRRVGLDVLAAGSPVIVLERDESESATTG